MEKIDYKKTLKHLYSASAKEVSLVDVPEARFVLIDGHGEPMSQAFTEAVEALFGISYALKFMCKKGTLGIDYGVMPLEGLWWVEDLSQFSLDDKSNWLWTVLIRQPDYITAEMFEEAVAQMHRRKTLAALDLMRFECFTEGAAAQVMHVGPFADEAPTIKKLHDFIAQQGYCPRGKHHEIYLSDIRKANSENLKTILRQPVEKLLQD